MMAGMIGCTCNCMDCIEGWHCGRGEPNPDGTPTVCLISPESHGLEEEEYDYDEGEWDLEYESRWDEGDEEAA